ncbi:Uso1_p115_C domain-containing protein [Haematococcus lacustris]|uniref:Uso1_p115_C domain-containing protein n=1 Tax=Haematococcus lacustris TaxID=44745 RepID=A0A699ZTG6_HAELA|nr:Uso1_p115_C domain-containing protein [Haematococcus lacustris]
MSGKGQEKVEVEEQMAQAAQQRLEEQVAAVRQQLQAELATRLQDQERECEARCVRLRQELAAGFEARIAAAEAELARSQQESAERGAELDELMACLGMAEEKCAALSDALIAAGKDADAIVAAVEDKYMSMPKDDDLGVDLM